MRLQLCVHEADITLAFSRTEAMKHNIQQLEKRLHPPTEELSTAGKGNTVHGMLLKSVFVCVETTGGRKSHIHNQTISITHKESFTLLSGLV